MTNGIENHGDSPKPASPGFKRYSGAKLVPLPSPIPQSNDKESFPVFLGMAIAFCILVLVAVFILSFTTTKKTARQATAPATGASPISLAHQ